MRREFMKKVLSFSVISLVLLFAGVTTTLGYDFDVMCGKFSLTGHFENLTGVRFQPQLNSCPDNPNRRTRYGGDLSMSRQTLQLETEYTYGEHLVLYSIFRFAYEGSYAYNIHRVCQSAAHVDDSDQEVREAYALISFPEWTFKIGKQQLVWGETDGFRMADIINPLDLSWHLNLESWEKIRRPLRMIVVNYAPTKFTRQNLSLELVFIPEDFLPTKYPNEGSNWQPAGFTQFVRAGFKASEPNSGNDQYGFRLRGVTGPVEWSLFNFYGRVQNPVIDITRLVQQLMGLRTDMEFARYPHYNATGITANYSEEIYTKTVWRFEGAYFFHEATNTDFTTIDKVDSIKFMLGFDRSTWIKLLNPTRTFFISGQWFHQTRFDWHKPLHSNDRNTDLLTLLVQGNYVSDRWSPQVLVAYDTNNNWWYAPGLTWNYSSNWKFGIEANLFSAPNKGIDTSFGPFRNNSEILLRIRYGFQ